MEKFETFAPLFPGFYGSSFEYDGEDNDIESYNEENGTNLTYDDFKWDYAGHNERIAKCFVNRLETEICAFIPVKIEYQSISSPKEYNFANDSINISVEVDLDELINRIKERKDAAAQYFKDKYTSCSGFISFHSPHLEMWIDKEYIMEKPDHRVGALLDCLCSIELDKDDIIYWCDSEQYADFSPNP